jgi:osmotically-inducible protein OsmY
VSTDELRFDVEEELFWEPRVDNELSVRLLDGDRRDDADVRGGVLQALMLDAAVPSSIDASVNDGIVTLTGMAPFNHQRAEAEFVAGNVPGVIGVHDQVELTIEDPTPADIRHSIKKAFKRDAGLDAEALSIDTFDGTVTLSGHVDSWVEHDAAVNAAWAAPGVRAVEDAIVVDY